jgi:hypothetical protein
LAQLVTNYTNEMTYQQGLWLLGTVVDWGSKATNFSMRCKSSWSLWNLGKFHLALFSDGIQALHIFINFWMDVLASTFPISSWSSGKNVGKWSHGWHLCKIIVAVVIYHAVMICRLFNVYAALVIGLHCWRKDCQCLDKRDNWG